LAACTSDDAPASAPLPAGAAGSGGGFGGAGAAVGGAGRPVPVAGRVGRAGASGAASGGTGALTPRAGAVASDDAGQEDPPPSQPDAAVGGAASFSDSFEAGEALDPARYEVVMPDCSGSGSATIDGSSAHSGTRSLRIQGAAGYCNHVFVRAKALTGALAAPLYVRVFIKVAAPLPAGHTTFVAMHDARENKALRLGGQNEVLVWNRESDDATLPELSPTGVGLSKPLTPATWHCLEWLVGVAPPAIATWLDGQPVTGLTLDAVATADVDRQWQRKADWAPQLDDLRLGWESYGDQTNTLWFDDLAVGTSRLACSP